MRDLQKSLEWMKGLKNLEQSHSETQLHPPAQESERLAPPMGRLLAGIPRERTSPASQAALTPTEDLRSGDGRVQVEEFNQVIRSLAHEDEEFHTQGWSGTLFYYNLGDQGFCLDKQRQWAFMQKRNDEISVRDLSAAEQKLFEESDKLEWQTILKTKAVRVIPKTEADKIRREHPDRIISSRMVRRKKPLPGLHQWKAKSRWCLHGHADPDNDLCANPSS